MTAHTLDEFDGALDALPFGTFKAATSSGRYIATKTRFNGGKSIKLVAEELGGSDYISFNYFRLSAGPRLFPCEMARDKVVQFVLDLRPDLATDHEDA